jgi:hypothetical protein
MAGMNRKAAAQSMLHPATKTYLHNDFSMNAVATLVEGYKC